MTDPLSEVITLIRPQTVVSRMISAAGSWAVRYSDFGQPSFCTVLEGRCHLVVDGQAALTLEVGDFVLLPATPGFTLSSGAHTVTEARDPQAELGLTDEIRHGRADGPPDLRLLGGYFIFGSPDESLLSSLLPALVHVRGAERLSTLVRLLGEESSTMKPGRELLLRRLVEILLIEALRATPSNNAPPGLLRGLADERLAQAIRQMHANPAAPWTVAQLASKASLSRSAFFERFNRAVGHPPMEYLLAWRMAMAKELLSQQNIPITNVAERVGYSSASTFSSAFSRYVGQPPRRYAQSSKQGAPGTPPQRSL